MLKKLSTILCALSLSIVILAGCSAQNTSAPSATKASETKSADSEGNGVLTVGVDDSYPPMEFKDESGSKTTGFDVDVANELAKRMGKSGVQFQSTAWDGIFVALDTKKFDCIISSVSINDERKAKFALTKPYIANKQVIVTAPSNSDINSLESLAGKKVSAQSGTTSDEILEGQKSAGVKMDYQKYDTVTQALDEVKLGRRDAALIDKVVAMYYVKMDPSKFKIAWESDKAEPLAICFRKEDSALRDKVDAIIDDMYKDGTMKNISIKWFGEDITSGVR